MEAVKAAVAVGVVGSKSKARRDSQRLTLISIKSKKKKNSSLETSITQRAAAKKKKKMWWQNPFQDNADSDQSISDEEELDDIFLGNSVSLQASATKKEELPLPLRLDFLRGARKQSLGGEGISSSFEKSAASPQEEEVEMPDFEEVNFSHLSGEAVANSSDEDIIHEDKGNTALSKFVIGSGTRVLHKYGSHFTGGEHIRGAAEEFESVSHVNELASCSATHAGHSKAKRSGDGIWRKAKPICSQQLPSHKVVPFGPSVSNCDSSVLFKMHRLPDQLEVAAGTLANSTQNSLEEDEGIENLSDIEPNEVEVFSHGVNQNPVTDFFDNLKDTNLLSGNSQKHSRRSGKRVRLFSRRVTSYLQEIIADSGDPVEPMGSGSSSENEVGNQNMKTALVEKKMLTMADRFQEALGASHVTDEGDTAAPIPLRTGIFGNLQRVMQREKERDINFRKEFQTGASPDSELGCFTVKLISRCLDAKLTVCHCSCGKYTENFPLSDNSKGIVSGGEEKTIIFSPRVCNNVDLEVGNLIRIHPPWKEVQVENDDVIILCTYFSQIS